MSTYKWTILIFFVLFFFVQCDNNKNPINNQNNPPVIDSVTASPDTILINENSTLDCDAEDDDELTYDWYSEFGTFPNGKSGDQVVWQASDSAGQFIISVTVSDGEIEVKDSISITVKDTTQQEIMEFDFSIPNSNISISMVKILPEPFYMGAPGTPGAGDDEAPKHLVNLSTPFWIGKFEVTQEQWKAVMGAKSFSFPGDKNPADNISWNIAKSFINALNNLEQDSLWRLPTEAEWEYACRGGVYDTRFWYGDDLNYSLTNNYSWNSTNSGGRTHRVGTTSGGIPNPFGIWDMGGNVWEWCEDWYHWGYVGAPTDGSAWVDPPDTRRILRGGSYYEDGRRGLPNLRSMAPPNIVGPMAGFRLAREIR